MDQLFKVLLIDDVDTDYLAIGERLKRHLKTLKFDRRKSLDAEDFKLINGGEPLFSADDMQLTFGEAKRCEKRASDLVKRRLSGSGLTHLKEDDLKRLKDVIRGVRLSGLITEDRADEIAAEVHAEFPWMKRANEFLWHSMRRSSQRGEPVHLGPVLLNGSAGLGKTAWSTHVSEKLRLPFTSVDVSSGAGQFALTGLERGWTGAEDGRVVRTILQHRIGNPVIIIDELDKSADMTSRKGRHLSIEKSLLPMLEPESARHWTCPYFAVPFDLSKVSWILASNDVSNVMQPLRSRMQLVELSAPSIKELIWFADREAGRLHLSDAATGAVIEALEDSVKMLRRDLDLRDVKRLLQRAEALENRPTFH